MTILTRKEGLATQTATVPFTPIVTASAEQSYDPAVRSSRVQSHDPAVRDASTLCVPEVSLGLSSNRGELATQKTAQSLMKLSDCLLVRKYAQCPSGAVDGHRVTTRFHARADGSMKAKPWCLGRLRSTR